MSGSTPGRRDDRGERESGETASRPPAARGRGRRRTGDPSLSRPRSADAVWPEHFVESVAVEIATEAARSAGRLAAAPAVVAIFQVCSTWTAISRSEFLWQVLCRRIWSRRRPSFPSWREEYIRLHRTGANFRAGRYAYSHLVPLSPPGLSCRRLALSHHYLAAGFFDGSVRLFDLPDGQFLTAYQVDPLRDRLGHFSRAVAGIVLLDEPRRRLTFASLDGDVHVVALDDDVASASVRRAFVGDVVVDGTMVDFAGDARWWVGLFAGVPGRSWHVWNAVTEQLTFVGGSLMDSNAILGWRMLTDASPMEIGRVRIAEPGIAVGCTAGRMEVIDLEMDDAAMILNQLDMRRAEAVVWSMDACEGRAMVVDTRCVAKVMQVPLLEETSRFNTQRRGEGQQEGAARDLQLQACMNWGYVVVFSPRGGRVWDAMSGDHLYMFRERIGMAAVTAAGERYVVAWAMETGLHLWDFGALFQDQV